MHPTIEFCIQRFSRRQASGPQSVRLRLLSLRALTAIQQLQENKRRRGYDPGLAAAEEALVEYFEEQQKASEDEEKKGLAEYAAQYEILRDATLAVCTRLQRTHIHLLLRTFDPQNYEMRSWRLEMNKILVELSATPLPDPDWIPMEKVHAYFSSLVADEVTLTFEEFEDEVLHDRLPSSARNSKIFWDNNPLLPVGNSLFLAGWRVDELWFEREEVSFARWDVPHYMDLLDPLSFPFNEDFRILGEF